MNLKPGFVKAIAVFAAAVGVAHGQSAVGHSHWPGPGSRDPWSDPAATETTGGEGDTGEKAE
jgi:hypothetical protein